MKNINVKITDYQEEKIKSSGLTTSEFVRRAIDEYQLETKEMVFNEVIISFFGMEFYQENKDIVKLIFTKGKEKLYNGKENLYDGKNKLYPDNNGKIKLYGDKAKLYEGKEKLYDNKAKLYEGKEKLYEGKEIAPDQLYYILEEELPTIQKQLLNPLNLNSLTDEYIKKLMKDYNLSKKNINNFIAKYKDKIKSLETRDDEKIIHHDEGIKR